jgi:hypothetical protein
MTVTVKIIGSFKELKEYLTNLRNLDFDKILRENGQAGVNALSRATPVDTGLASHSWDYEIESSRGLHTITWTNSDVENGFPVVIRLQYGHGTGTGGYVSGIDFINPAIRPVFDDIAEKVWEAVISL